MGLRLEDPSFADTLVPEQAEAGAAPAAAASSVTIGEAPSTKVTSRADSKSEASSKLPKRARLTAVHLPEMGVTPMGSDTIASAGGVPPQHCEAPSWLVLAGEDDAAEEAAEAGEAPDGG